MKGLITVEFDTNDPPRDTCGIYAIYSACNDTIYIGYSGDILARWKRHKSNLRCVRHKNRHLLNAWNKYGPEAFEFYVIEECPEEMLHIREQFHLDRYPNHYNIGECAASPRRGVPLPPETRAKMSAARMGNTNSVGRKHSPETRAKISEANKGHEVSEETRARISAANTGRKHTDEARANMSAAKIGNKYCVGVVASDEARANMSAARTGKVFTDEHRANLSAALIGNTRSLGHVQTDEHKANISAGMMGRQNTLGYKHTDEAKERVRQASTGRKHTPEAREKMRVVALAREARKREEKVMAND